MVGSSAESSDSLQVSNEHIGHPFVEERYPTRINVQT